MEGFSGIPHIALIGESAVFLQRHIPTIGFIVDIVLQVGGNLSDFQFLNVITPQIIIVMDIRVNIIAVQVFREVDDLLQATGIAALAAQGGVATLTERSDATFSVKQFSSADGE